MSDKEALTTSSLQALAAKEALSYLLASDLAIEKFVSLDPGSQEAIFRTLRPEIARLKEVEKDWQYMAENCPHLDLQIRRPLARIDIPKYIPDSDSDENNGYNEIDRIRETWSYYENEEGRCLKNNFKNL